MCGGGGLQYKLAPVGLLLIHHELTSVDKHKVSDPDLGANFAKSLGFI